MGVVTIVCSNWDVQLGLLAVGFSEGVIAQLLALPTFCIPMNGFVSDSYIYINLLYIWFYKFIRTSMSQIVKNHRYPIFIHRGLFVSYTGGTETMNLDC